MKGFPELLRVALIEPVKIHTQRLLDLSDFGLHGNVPPD
jgi:hypothetical protein